MAAVRGLGAVRVGDAIGVPPPGQEETARFPRPALEAVVFPLRSEQSGSLRAALAQLAEQDPLIDVRQDDHRHEIAVSLYGEVQKEVIQATLERDYGIAADFRETTVVCIERPAGVGEAEEVIQAKTKTNITGRSSPLSTNPFKATLALRIEPAPIGSGIEFRSEVEVRYVPLYIFNTVEAFATQMEAYVREALLEGLAGWQVTDCRVTMTDCGYGSPATSAADFRRLTQLVLTTALDRAGTWVCEPLCRACARDAIRDGPGCPCRPRPARRPRDGPVLGERPDEGERRHARGPRSLAAAPAAGAVDGGGDPRVPPWRLPTDRQRSADAPAHGPRARSTATPGSRHWRSGRECPPLSDTAMTRLQVAEQGQLDAVVRLVRDVMGDAAVGAYLYGSAVTSGLRRESDLDILVVSSRRTTEAERRALIDGLLPISGSSGGETGKRHLEVTVVARPDIQPWHYPPPMELQYGDWWRREFESGREPWSSPNPDLAVLLTAARADGVPLFGPPIVELVDPIPRDDLGQAMST